MRSGPQSHTGESDDRELFFWSMIKSLFVWIRHLRPRPSGACFPGNAACLAELRLVGGELSARLGPTETSRVSATGRSQSCSGGTIRVLGDIACRSNLLCRTHLFCSVNLETEQSLKPPPLAKYSWT